MIKVVISLLTTIIMLFGNLFGLTGYKGTQHEDYRIYKNVILMIGDGNGANTMAATRKYRNAELAMDSMPVHAWSQTRSLTNKVTDSAAGGTALATGVRTYNSAIGVYIFDPLGSFYNVPKNLSELAIENGKSAGVVTTDKTSGATPASFSAHSVERDFEYDISMDQMRSDLTLIWGGASDTVTEKRCAKHGFEYITTEDEMNALKPGTRSFGQFSYSDLGAIDNSNGTPLIADMTSKAIELLNADEDGFFLMVEGAHIDKNSHSNNMDGATAHEVEFSKALQVALDFAEEDGDTLVVVTADHETGGITYNEATGEYYYTTGSHTGVDVPCFVSATDAGFVDGEHYKNCDISVQIARVMGYNNWQFPALRWKNCF
ncbi:MAG: alkaline phosphatase [Clostridia bacterium]|nr:alkaline phosphatase [Clostridia bacterium]